MSRVEAQGSGAPVGPGASDAALRAAVEAMIRDMLNDSDPATPLRFALERMLRDIQAKADAEMKAELAATLALLEAYMKVNAAIQELMRVISNVSEEDGSIKFGKGSDDTKRKAIIGAQDATKAAIHDLNLLLGWDDRGEVAPPPGVKPMTWLNVFEAELGSKDSVTASAAKVQQNISYAQGRVDSNNVEVNLKMNDASNVQDRMQRVYQILVAIAKTLSDSIVGMARGIKG